jgi:hypothetical protein
MDFEGLGVFYLGRHVDPETQVVQSTPLLYDSKDLSTHAACLGMTGSGKTGLCISLLEEAGIDGVPAICIDPKGDLANLLLTFPSLLASDFEPWVDPVEAERQGRTVAEHAEAEARSWREGLHEWGQDGDRIARLRQAVDIAIYTPGSSAGPQVAALRSFEPPRNSEADGDQLREEVMGAVSSLLSLLGVDADPVQSREHILLSNILTQAWSEGRSLELAELIHRVTDPPFDRVGVMDLQSFYPAEQRHKLALQLNALLASPGFSAWLEGEPLDVRRFLWTAEGKPRISIFSIAHLSDAERMFFVSLLLNQLVSWMRRQPGTGSLRAICYMDEVFGFLPPVAEPASKRPLLSLLKQGRAFGLGVVLATQNPADIDYKALSNCGTWFLGRLQTERDLARVLDGLAGAAEAARQSLDRGTLQRTLAGLKSRVFLMHNTHEQGSLLFRTRWALSYLRGPLTRAEIARLCPKEQPAGPPSAPAEHAAGAAQAPLPGEPRPVLPAGIEESFVRPGTEPAATGSYVPHLLARVRLHYRQPSHGLDEWEDGLLLTRLEPSETGSVWDEASWLGSDELSLSDEPQPGRAFSPPAPDTLGRQAFRSHAKELRAHLYQNRSRTLWRCKALKLRSRPGETEADFSARAQLVAREKRDAAVDALRGKFARKLEQHEARVRRAEERLAREQSQYEQQKLETGISVGATVLGALFGSRAVGRATTAARGASRAARERQDVVRAEEALEALLEQGKTLQAQVEAAIDQLRQSETFGTPEIESVVVRPIKSDIDVVDLRLAWR